MKIKLYALQRSGSTYFEWLLKNNFGDDVEVIGEEVAGWKHALPQECYLTNMKNKKLKEPIRNILNREKIQPIVIYKDFDNWVKSIYRRPICYFNMGRPDPTEFYWKFYYEWARNKALFVKYENFIKDFEGTLDKVGELIGSKPISYKEPDEVWNSPNWIPEDRKRYL